MIGWQEFMITGAGILTFGILLGYFMNRMFGPGRGEIGAELFDAYRSLETVEQRQQLLSLVQNFCQSSADLQTALCDQAQTYRELTEKRDYIQKYDLKM